MARQSNSFFEQELIVKELQENLRREKEALQNLCNHEYPPGISFTDCMHCGMSSYYDKYKRGMWG